MRGGDIKECEGGGSELQNQYLQCTVEYWYCWRLVNYKIVSKTNLAFSFFKE